jgi:hypothetical protein
MPAGSPEQRGDPPISVATVLAGQQDRGLGESIFIFPLCRLIALCAAWLVCQLTRSALAHALLLRMIHRTSSSLRA